MESSPTSKDCENRRISVTPKKTKIYDHLDEFDSLVDYFCVIGLQD